MMNETHPTGSQIASTSKSGVPLGQEPQQEVNNQAATDAKRRRLIPNLPREYLMRGPREDYLRFGVPLYEASIRCDWKAAKAILNERPDLIRCSITDNGETALHIASTVKRSKQMEKFVENLVDIMKKEDLELENKNYNTAFYLAAAGGNITALRIMIKKSRNLSRIPGASDKLPLYVAALFGNHEVVKYLHEISNDLCDDDGWNTQNRGWLLEKCVQADIFDIALKIANIYPQLGTANVLGNLARKPEAFFKAKSNIMKRSINSAFALTGITAEDFEKDSEALQMLKIIWKYISKRPRLEIDRTLRGSADLIKEIPEDDVLIVQLQILISEQLEKLEVETQEIMKGQPDASKQDTQLVSGKIDQALQLQKLISQHLKNMHAETQNLIKQVYSKTSLTLRIQNIISDHIIKMHGETQRIIKQEYEIEKLALNLQAIIDNRIKSMRHLMTHSMTFSMRSSESYSSRVLFIAAEMGNTLFLTELIKEYPDLVWKVNDCGHSIFHIAVKYRHAGIYILLYEIGAMKDLITPLKDEHGNNMLHLAGKITIKERLADVSGAALQMQRELLWFNEVRNMIPPSYRERKNKDGLTPRELFSMEHKVLIREGEKWMKETASQCMVVATLIATIVFAAAFTIPGGYNQDNGIPIFYQKPIFVVFVVADAMSLFLSSASILTFLSILTSRYAERDFVESLPTKLMLGLVTLFLSMTTMMITFSVSFFILYNKEMKWIPILISVVALAPVVLYVGLQYHVLADVIRSTYGSKYLFKPSKQFLYYVNPRV